MTWEQFWNLVSFAPPSVAGIAAMNDAEQQRIEDALRDLWDSPAAQVIMINAVAGGPLVIARATNGEPAFAHSPLNLVAINYTELQKYFFFNRNGELVQEKETDFALTLIHEISHLTGTTDPNTAPGYSPPLTRCLSERCNQRNTTWHGS